MLMGTFIPSLIYYLPTFFFRSQSSFTYTSCSVCDRKLESEIDRQGSEREEGSFYQSARDHFLIASIQIELRRFAVGQKSDLQLCESEHLRFFLGSYSFNRVSSSWTIECLHNQKSQNFSRVCVLFKALKFNDL